MEKPAVYYQTFPCSGHCRWSSYGISQWLVGHQGKSGCHLYCSVMGRHNLGSPHCYPALLKPHTGNYDVEGCNHNDISHTNLSSSSLEKYYNNLCYLMSIPNETQYKKWCLETGISKPSIILGLQEVKTLRVPNCFGSYIMHLLSLNIPDLLVNLWRGMLDCDKSNDHTTWDWATLRGNVWEMHGQQVASATPYLPGSFDHPPCNPAEKISSGYKAWEFLMHLFGLGPGLLYNVLPEKYWKNFCKLVYGGQIINQYMIKMADLQKAHHALLEFVYEFEVLYYQRRTDHLHFVRQSIHAVTHLNHSHRPPRTGSHEYNVNTCCRERICSLDTKDSCMLDVWNWGGCWPGHYNNLWSWQQYLSHNGWWTKVLCW